VYCKGNVIVVRNIEEEAIPDYSFARIVLGTQFDIVKPDLDNKKHVDIVVVPMLIPAGERGFAYIDGICIVKKTDGESIIPGDKVGTDEETWTAKKIENDSLGNNDGQFYVLDTFGETDEYLVIRPRVMESMIAFGE
jgi:hypothetical protein